MAKMTITGTRPQTLDPHEVELSGYYQSDPGAGHRPAGDDVSDDWWKDATWTEVVRFVPVAPWASVNEVISGVGVNAAGSVVISGGIDLSHFMVSNAVAEDKRKMAALLADPHKVLTREDIGRIVLFLVEQWSGGKASTGSPT